MKQNRHQQPGPITLAAESSAPLEAQGGDPFVLGKRAYMEQFGPYVRTARQWRLAALGALAVAVAAVLGMGYSASQNHFIPYVVAVDKLGVAVAAGRADSASRADTRIIRAQLARWISSCRAVFVDASAQRQAVNECFSMISKGSPSYTTLNEFYRAASPFERAEKEAVNADVHTALPIAGNTWRIEWTEIVRGRNGEAQGKDEWQASVTITQSPPNDEPGIQKNPLGIYITDLSWTKRL